MRNAGERILELRWGGAAYEGVSFADNVGGCAGVELHRTIDGKRTLVAKLTFWDATGQYWLETLGTDLPLGVISKLITTTTSFVGERIVGPS